MSIDYANIIGLSDHIGNIVKITDASGKVLWNAVKSIPAVLQVEKVTATTYAAETTYTDEEFILLDIYPKTNGTVSVTYGGLTKTITDTSGVEEPNAQQVYFGTFNGIPDTITTPASGELVIEGDFYAYGCGSFQNGSKSTNIGYSSCITAVTEWGSITEIPNKAFRDCNSVDFSVIPEGVTAIGVSAFTMQNTTSPITAITLPSTLESIGEQAFTKTVTYFGSGTDPKTGYSCFLKEITFLSTIPPTYGSYAFWGATTSSSPLEKAIVPAGCSEAYATAFMYNASYSPRVKEIVEAE